MKLIVIITGLIGIIEKNENYYLLIPTTGADIHEHQLIIENTTEHSGNSHQISGPFDGFFIQAEDWSFPNIPIPCECPSIVNKDYVLKMRELLASNEGFTPLTHLVGDSNDIKAKFIISEPQLMGIVHHNMPPGNYCSRLKFRRNPFLKKGQVYVAESIVFSITLAEDNYYLYNKSGEPIKIKPWKENGESALLKISHLPKIKSPMEPKEEKNYHENALFDLYRNHKNTKPKLSKRYFAKRTSCNCKANENPQKDLTTQDVVVNAEIWLEILNPWDRLACPPYILDEDI